MVASFPDPNARTRDHKSSAVLRVFRASVVILFAACGGETKAAVDPRTLAWDTIEARARGTTVTWRMWRGDPSINAYVDRWVAPRLLERHGITLRAIEGQGPEIVNQLLIEKEAGAGGSADLVWINGETFHNLREADLLYGPWAHRLPNAAYVDSASPTIQRDFEQPTDGYESPWGTVQFALIYDSTRTPNPPDDRRRARRMDPAAPWTLHPRSGLYRHHLSESAALCAERRRGIVPGRLRAGALSPRQRAGLGLAGLAAPVRSGAQAPRTPRAWPSCIGCSRTARWISPCP